MIPSFCPGGETLTISSLPHVGLCLFNIQPASPSASWAGKGKRFQFPKLQHLSLQLNFIFVLEHCTSQEQEGGSMEV